MSFEVVLEAELSGVESGVCCAHAVNAVHARSTAHARVRVLRVKQWFRKVICKFAGSIRREEPRARTREKGKGLGTRDE